MKDKEDDNEVFDLKKTSLDNLFYFSYGEPFSPCSFLICIAGMRRKGGNGLLYYEANKIYVCPRFWDLNAAFAYGGYECKGDSFAGSAQI